LPVGVPVPWPSATPPTGWLKCNGSTFSLTSFPALAAVFPSGKLPDLRGEFIRGWDDGRNIDTGRSILTSQSGSVLGRFIGVSNGGDLYTAVYDVDGEGIINSGWVRYGSSGIVSPAVGQTGGTVRPRNIAFNYIVRAA
ncbi:TPA: tail fiber protein, partial [Enterobacter roggenkampii]|nr:tail fiber protein [Enterobacter roggenkampii]